MEYFSNIDIAEDNTGLICQGDAGSIDLETLGQYIEEYDKNDDEIWEGDVIKIRFKGRREYTYGIVRVKMPIGAFIEHVKGPDEFYEYYGYITFSWNELIVIGNIHENPELIQR